MLGPCTFLPSEAEPHQSPCSALTSAFLPDVGHLLPSREGCFRVGRPALGLLRGHLNPSGAVKEKQPVG